MKKSILNGISGDKAERMADHNLQLILVFAWDIL